MSEGEPASAKKRRATESGMSDLLGRRTFRILKVVIPKEIRQKVWEESRVQYDGEMILIPLFLLQSPDSRLEIETWVTTMHISTDNGNLACKGI